MDIYGYYKVMILWTFMYNFLWEHMFSILLGIYLRVKFLSHDEFNI